MSVSFKHLDPTSFPPDWSVDFFGNLVDFKLGKTPPRGSPVYWKEGKYPWVSISDMTPHGVVTETSEKVSQQAYDTVFSGCLVPEGSLLMSFKLTIGRISRLGMPAFHNEAIISFQPDQETLNDDFLGYYLSQINYKDYQDTAIKGQTLNKGKLNSLEIALPPLPEQKKIAHVLSTVQRAIEAQERIIQTTTELKKTLMHKLFTECLRNEPQKQTEIGLVPESWKAITLGELCGKPNGALQTGPFGSQLHKSDYQETGVAVVNPTHLAGNRINHEEVPRVSEKVADQLKRHRLQELDILFARRGEIGRHGLVTKADKGWLCGTGCFLVRASKPFIDNRFLSYYFSTEPLIKWLYSHAAGAIMPNLNNTVLKRLPVYYPRISVQREIVELFEKADRKTTIAKRKRNIYKALFRTLLHELMTAKIRVDAVELYQPTLSGRK